MNILPFAKPYAHTSPQHDLASVGVKHTPSACESGVDWFREALSAAIAGRSPEAVTRMEKARGLR
jgi:hypothetical protein